MVNKQKNQRRYFFPFFLILFIGLTGVFFTKTDVGFNIVYKILRNQINKHFDYSFSIHELNKNLNADLQANYLEFANDDSSIVLSIDTININYSGIFELLGKRHLDSLSLIEPKIFIRINERDRDLSEIPDFTFPDVHISNIRMKDVQLYIQTPDTLVHQMIQYVQLEYLGRKDGAVLHIDDMQMVNEALDLQLYDLSSEIVFKNDIAKMRKLNFKLNDAQFASSGKIRFIEPFRFQFSFNVKDVDIEKYLHTPIFYPEDQINMQLDVRGDFKEFSATANFSGTLNQEKIHYANINMEYKNDYLHLLKAGFKNSSTNISLYGSYGLKDKYITTTFTSLAFTPSEWIESLPEFDFQGFFRASGYLDDRLRVSYDFDCNEFYGIEKTTLRGDIFFYGLNDIVLDSSNYIYLPDGLLKMHGNITNLDSINLDIYGDIHTFNDLEIPDLGTLKTDNMMLTLKLLGRLTDPDIQLNFNLDTLVYDIYKINNLNVSLYSNKIISNPQGGVLISFENAVVDSFLIGSLETYVRVDEDMIYMDYLEISHENYLINLSGSIKDFKEFTINTMEGKYQGQDVYLLDTLSFSIDDNGFSLSRFDILYREALLYGSMDVKNDSIWGSINITGAELNSLPLISTMLDGVEGVIKINIDIDGYLDNPVINANMELKHAHAFGLDAERIHSQMQYNDNILQINNFRIDIVDDRSVNFRAELPVNINFNRKSFFKILPEDSVWAEFTLSQTRLSKILPFIIKKLPITGDGDISGDIYGTLNDPIIDGKLFVLNPVIGKIIADTLISKFHYFKENLYFNEAYIIANNGYYHGNASIHIDLRYNAPGSRFSPDSSIYAYVQGNDDELLYLTPYLGFVESLTGDFYTELEIEGSFNETVKNGSVRINNGHLILGVLGNEIENLNGEAVITDNILNVDLQGKLPSVSYTLAGILGLTNPSISEEYNFTVGGDMNMTQMFKPVFNLSLTGDQISIVTLDESINMTTGEVDLTITGQDTLLISGDVNIQEGLIEASFNNRPSEVRDNTRNGRLSTEYAINTVIDKIYFRNQFIDATLEGECILLKYASEDKVRIGGQLDVTQGFFNYWASVFELEEGSILFDQFEGNHELNFRAYKDISGGNRIIASINGEIDNLEIDFVDEDNQMSKAEIIQELTIGEFSDLNTGSAMQATTALLALVERPIEQQAQKLGGIGGLDRIDIKGGEGTYIDSTTAVVVGGRIGRNFYLTYEGSRSDPLNIEIEYRINNRLSIVGSADEESVSGAFRLRIQY